MLDVLAERGYVDIAAWRLTDRGQMLARVFHECDLLVAEVVGLGLLDGVDAATLAGLVSTFVYEHRSPDDPPSPWFPSDDGLLRAQEVRRADKYMNAGLGVL